MVHYYHGMMQSLSKVLPVFSLPDESAEIQQHVLGISESKTRAKW